MLAETPAAPSTEGPLRILVLGDVVGQPGRDAICELLPRMRSQWRLDLVVANAENAAAGSGITPRLHRELRGAGIDIMTLGDHAWKRRENLEVLRKESAVLRPGNYPPEALGGGVLVHELPCGTRVGVVTVLGRIFMAPVACPFLTIDAALASFPEEVRVRLVEIHAEATSEKVAVGWHLDGRASCVFGTHTHVPTADDRILPGGTAYITDLGMCGPYDGVIGRTVGPVLHKFITSMHATFTVAQHNVHLCGILLEVDRASGKALSVRRVDVAHDAEAVPHGRELPLTGQELSP